jgi:hypothetical protein
MTAPNNTRFGTTRGARGLWPMITLIGLAMTGFIARPVELRG